jgi:hypothetical protein
MLRSRSFLVVLVLVGWASSTQADPWDLNLARLCQIRTQNGTLYCGGGYSASSPILEVVPDNAAFRSLMSELGVVFAPNVLSPSDTKGYSGFSVASEFAWVKINANRTAADPRTGSDLQYWRAAESVSSKVFGGQSLDQERLASELPSGFAPTVTVMARKGLWLPVPSFEIGLGARHLIGSQMWAPLATAKIALHEGFHGWPVPSLAVRGTGTRVMGTPGFNLSVAGLDFSVSKQIGLFSSFNITPYAGYQLLWIIASSEVLDATPGVDAMAKAADQAQKDPLTLTQCRDNDCNGNFTFASQANITRHRAFFGLRANFYIASLLVEYSYFASGSTSDEIAVQAGQPLLIPDGAGTQHSISFALALEY